MIDFIPLNNYYEVYIYFCLLLVLANLLHAYTLGLNDVKNLKFLRTSGLILFVLVVIYLGLRPISGRKFADMATYAEYFKYYASGGQISTEKDIVFHIYIKALSSLVGIHGFFLITMILYTVPKYLISKKYFKEYWFYAFLMFVVSFSFYSYGTNGIRNGIATSMFLWGLCYTDKKTKMSLFFLLSVLFHKSLLLPVGAYILTMVHNNPKTYMKVWLIAIPLSLVLGSVFITIFSSLGFDDRLASYISGTGKTDVAIKTGFRWDFLFFSSFAVFSGWYFIIKKRFNDFLYYQIFNTYLICNAFWILVIRASFSNRFAYLSWFLMAVVIIYPLLKQHFYKNQQIMISKVVTAYFLFTFLMFLIYYF